MAIRQSYHTVISNTWAAVVAGETPYDYAAEVALVGDEGAQQVLANQYDQMGRQPLEALIDIIASNVQGHEEGALEAIDCLEGLLKVAPIERADLASGGTAEMPAEFVDAKGEQYIVAWTNDCPYTDIFEVTVVLHRNIGVMWTSTWDKVAWPIKPTLV